MNMPLEDSGKPVEGLYYPTPVTPEEAFQAIGRLRKEARDEINRLIRFLDSTENHMEREPEDEGDDADCEPSLGSFDRMTNQDKAWRTQILWSFPAVDGEQDGADNEPSLGSITNYAQSNQEQWAAGDRRELEVDGGDSGIGDLDGVLEQAGGGGWQGDRTGMV